MHVNEIALSCMDNYDITAMLWNMSFAEYTTYYEQYAHGSGAFVNYQDVIIQCRIKKYNLITSL